MNKSDEFEILVAGARENGVDFYNSLTNYLLGSLRAELIMAEIQKREVIEVDKIIELLKLGIEYAGRKMAEQAS